MNPVYLLAWLPETLLNEKGQAEWDKFVKIEERTAVDAEDEGTLVVSFTTRIPINDALV